jgi:hypothetical protein
VLQLSRLATMALLQPGKYTTNDAAPTDRNAFATAGGRIMTAQMPLALFSRAIPRQDIRGRTIGWLTMPACTRN